ncbi:MAG: SEC-C domain-containing protein [Alkalimonas sp.]|nr:SEC-C domain-containing protein [Alkalimonas sp.]
MCWCGSGGLHGRCHQRRADILC